MELEEVIKRMKKHNMAELARDTGINPSTLSKIVTGRIKAPSYPLMVRIIKWMDGN